MVRLSALTKIISKVQLADKRVSRLKPGEARGELSTPNYSNYFEAGAGLVTGGETDGGAVGGFLPIRKSRAGRSL